VTADHGIAEQQLLEAETALRKGVGVFVSGPPGSGRQVVLQALAAQIERAEAGCEANGPAWQNVLDADTTGRLRCFWHALRAQVGERLPLPIVEHIAGDLRCTWSYARLRVQADLYDDGTVGWYARDAASAASEAGDDDVDAPGAALVSWVKRAADC
jgi:hypothetical protein